MPRKRFNSVLRVPKSTRSSIDQGPSVLSSDGASESRKRPGKVIGYWLLGTAGLVYGIVVLGGLTRLTESGLSITEWKPVTGSIPPMTEAAWNSEFDLYKSSPEFKILNADLNLEEFKFIYNMEWSHRQLGRTIGLVFAVPALAIILRRRYPAKFRAKLGAISCLIGFQGFIGWWMVRSGLKEDLTNPRVSQYRLATHLGTAFLVYLSMLHTSLTILTPSNGNLTQSSVINQRQLLALPSFRRSLLALGGLTFLTAISGAFVAGLDAGLIYNDFPYMGNSYIPPTGELLIGLPTLNDTSSLLATIVHNMFENPVLAQLDHRILAMTTATSTLALAGWTTVKCQQGVLPKVALRGIAGVTALVLMQATLGICTLWYLVPTPLAATHQAGSLAVLTGIVLCLARTRTGHTSRFIASVGLRA
ncbi:protein of unknown function [Taphrina deformans PYCC 5710]|uniref:Cytochrome c oxidase assembly protein cox15 n=1 Tax=Taphrina deformans (strain PYCC 5710 / ATCC 11124 / CBS 356.35 / IMI 108563 / JCM 9778 / NBRC 8474) TaxID=1097556 RepID=R4XFE8_TAPDE|nr:protein of unknown function [Taphrina deformans PYCC 5710]|eukprot:CCG84501.1 protein of unknown function [Taphrina deformans PYCC 5710]